MSNDARPRGLGRGLSALLGEPQRGEPVREAARAEAPRAGYQPSASSAGAAIATPANSISTAPLATADSSSVVRPFPTPDPAAQATPPVAAAGGPMTLALDAIEPNEAQPRRRFDEAELEELAQSIKAHGVLQPILVRPLPGRAGRFEIIAGERRWRAAQRAGLAAIPALVRAVSDGDQLEIAIIENVQRADLNPVEEAQGYQALMERFGRTQQDVADIVGKSRSHVANMLRLLLLPQAIQEMLREGRLSAGHARALLTSADPLALARRALSEGLSVREVERLAAQAKDSPADVKAVSTSDRNADIVALEQMLSRALGLGVTIRQAGEGGEVRIVYKRAEQLDDLCRRLTGS